MGIGMKRLLIGFAVFAWSAPALAQNGGDSMRADTNGDGRITRAEFDVLREAGFARLDANGDGYLSSDETQSAGRMAQRFTRADADSDGRVSRREFMSQPPRGFMRFDANHDDMLDASEVARLREAMQRFGG